MVVDPSNDRSEEISQQFHTSLNQFSGCLGDGILFALNPRLVLDSNEHVPTRSPLSG